MNSNWQLVETKCGQIGELKTSWGHGHREGPLTLLYFLELSTDSDSGDLRKISLPSSRETRRVSILKWIFNMRLEDPSKHSDPQRAQWHAIYYRFLGMCWWEEPEFQQVQWWHFSDGWKDGLQVGLVNIHRNDRPQDNLDWLVVFTHQKPGHDYCKD